VKLIVAAFWVEDDDCQKAMDLVTTDPVPGIQGSGAAVSFSEKVAADPEFKHTLARFDLHEAAYWDGVIK
jgi:hypothetical protein